MSCKGVNLRVNDFLRHTDERFHMAHTSDDITVSGTMSRKGFPA